MGQRRNHKENQKMSSDLKNDELLVRLTKKEPMTPIMDIKCERDDITTNLTDLKKKIHGKRIH